jgi:hypothetical protein
MTRSTAVERITARDSLRGNVHPRSNVEEGNKGIPDAWWMSMNAGLDEPLMPVRETT